MNRLTNKHINWYNDFVFSLRNRLITTDEINESIYKRLKLLEDLEEEIGMSLLLLFRILKHGRIIHKYKLFCTSKKMNLESSIINGLFYESGQYGLEVYNEEDDIDDIDEEYNDFKYVYVKDYGITWAIKEEELEYDK